MSLKSNLKAAKQCLLERDYEQCLEICNGILDDKVNYNALILSAAAYKELKNYEKSKRRFEAAIRELPLNITAYQGLLSVRRELNEDCVEVLETMIGLEGAKVNEIALELVEHKLEYVKYLPNNELTKMIEREFVKIKDLRFKINGEEEYYTNSPLPVIFEEAIGRSTNDGADITDLQRNSILLDYLEFLWKKSQFIAQPKIIELLDQIIELNIESNLASDLYVNLQNASVFDVKVEIVKKYRALKQDLDSFKCRWEEESLNYHSHITNDVIESNIEDSLDSTLLGQRIKAFEYYFSLEYQLCIEIICGAVSSIADYEKRTGKALKEVRVELLILQARASFKLNWYHDSLKYFELSLQYKEDSVAALTGCAQSLLQLGKSSEAYTIFSKLISINHHETMKSDFGWCLNLMHRSDEAMQYLENAPSTFLNSYRRAKLILHSAPKSARELILTAVKANPHFSPLFTLLGQTFLAENDLVRATKCFAKAVSEGDNFFAVEELTKIWIDQDRISESLEVLESCKSYWVSPKIQKVVVDGSVEEENENGYVVARLWERLGFLRLTTGGEAMEALRNAVKYGASAKSYLYLTEAYYIKGQFQAALRVVDHITINSEETEIKVHLLFWRAKINFKLRKYEDSLSDLKLVLEKNQSSGLWGFWFNVAIEYSSQCHEDGSYGAEAAILTEIIKRTENLIPRKESGHILCLAAAIEAFAKRIPGLITEYVRNLIDRVINSLISIYPREWKIISGENKSENSSLFVLYGYCYFVGACSSGIVDNHNDPIHLSNIFSKIAEAFFCAYNESNSQKYYEMSLVFGLKALENDQSHLNAVGILLADKEPILAQHMFIEALNTQASAIVWCNLGFLYYNNNELELADRSFEKAVNLDAEFPYSWVGKGLVEQLRGETSKFNRAYDLAGPIPLIVRLFIKHVSNTESENVDDSIKFALLKVIEQGFKSDDIFNEYGQVCERLGLNELAANSYKEALIVADEKSLPMLQAGLARSLCAAGDYKEAQKVYEQIVDLSDPLALAGYGLVLYFMELYEKSFEIFENALEKAELFHGSILGYISIMVAQVLYAIGGEEHLEIAQGQLIQCFEKTPSFAPAILTLCCLGMVTGNWELTTTAASELINLEGSGKWNAEINYVMSRIYLLQGKFNTARNYLCKSILRAPGQSNLWNDLQEFLIRTGNAASVAKFMEKPAENYLVSHSPLLKAMSFLACGNLKDASKQFSRAVLMNPRKAENWIGISMYVGNFRANLSKRLLANAKIVNQQEDMADWITMLIDAHNNSNAFDNEGTIAELDNIASSTMGRKKEASLLLMGKFLVNAQDTENAKLSFHQAVLEIENFRFSQDLGSIAELSLFFEQTGNPMKALRCLDKIIELNPKSSDCFCAAALSLRINDLTNAVNYLNQGLILNPNAIAGKFIQTVIDKKKQNSRYKKNLALIGESDLEDSFKVWINEI